jgi:hypothetical protein
MCVAAMFAAPVAAQTRFEWRDTTVDLGKYTTVEQCLAAAKRVGEGQVALHSQIVWRDTMPYDVQELMKPLQPPTVQAAARCAAKFDQRTANLTDLAPLMRLYLVADRDADAKALLGRRLAAIPAKNVKEQIATEDSAVDIYLSAVPRRLDAAEQLLIARARSGPDRLDRLALYLRMMNAATEAGDTVRGRRAGEWLVATADSLTQAERESEKFEKLGPEGGNVTVFAAMLQIAGVKTLSDSLRHSSMAMVGLMRKMWSQFTKERAEALPFPLGEHAPQVVGDIWYPREAAGEKHPAAGHVSIVEFVDASALNGSCLGVSGWGVVTDACIYSFSLLRRLSERYPGLDITLVVGTRGNFLYAPPPTPAEEAELYHNWIEPFHIKGVVMSVTTRPFWNFPAPDGRRIDKLTPNSIAYGFRKSWAVEGSGTGGKYLIDQDGIIVDVSFNEPATLAFLDVLMHRQQGGVDRAAR